jgi:hypothetical protein
MQARGNFGYQNNGYPMPGMVDNSIDNSQMALNERNNTSMNTSFHNTQSSIQNGHPGNQGMKGSTTANNGKPPE